MDYKLTDFLPTTKKECELRGWDELDVILFSGDAYVDHPSFGSAILGRILEANGGSGRPRHENETARLEEKLPHGIRVMAIVWLLCLNQTGMVISVISKSSDVHVCSLAFLQEPWTRW